MRSPTRLGHLDTRATIRHLALRMSGVILIADDEHHIRLLIEQALEELDRRWH
jgi:hypothetical protein